jgi:hypothetical protein
MGPPSAQLESPCGSGRHTDPSKTSPASAGQAIWMQAAPIGAQMPQLGLQQ